MDRLVREQTDCEHTCSNVADNGLHRNKTVECQLEKMYENIAVTEANIELFNTMISLGLATNDVKNFVRKQIIHKRTTDKPDFKDLLT